MGSATIASITLPLLFVFFFLFFSKSDLDGAKSNQPLRSRILSKDIRTSRAPGLQNLFSQVDRREQLDAIYGASTVSGETTLSRAIAACGDCQSFSFFGVAENWDSPLFPAGGWIGKTVTGTRNPETGDMDLTIINNYNDGGTQFPAKLSMMPLRTALGCWFHFMFVLGFPPFKSFDQDDALIIDYRPDWVPGVDGARPVTQSGLEAAGITITEDITDMWAGYLVITFLGIFNVYSHYFVVQFDLDKMVIEP